MGDDVRNFLIDLASDADRQARFKENPGGELARTRLSFDFAWFTLWTSKLTGCI